jgi:hypothetical protein
VGTTNEELYTDTELQLALDQCDPDGCTVILEEGVYLITQTSFISSHTTLKGQGKESTILRLADNVNDHILQNSNVDSPNAHVNSDIRIENLKIEGNSANNQLDTPDGDKSKGIFFKNTDRTTIKNVWIEDTMGNGMTFSGDGDNRPEILDISFCWVSDVQSKGIAVNQVNIVSVIFNKTWDTINQGIHIGYGRMVHVIGNATTQTGEQGIMTSYLSGEVIVANNIVKKTYRNGGIALSGDSTTKPMQAIGNQIINVAGPGMVSSHDFAIIANNIIRDDGQYVITDGIRILSGSLVNVHDNTFSGVGNNGKIAIKIYAGVDFLNLHDNLIQSNGLDIVNYSTGIVQINNNMIK